MLFVELYYDTACFIYISFLEIASTESFKGYNRCLLSGEHISLTYVNIIFADVADEYNCLPCNEFNKLLRDQNMRLIHI